MLSLDRDELWFVSVSQFVDWFPKYNTSVVQSHDPNVFEGDDRKK